MKRKTTILTIICLSVTTVFAGCGGGSSSYKSSEATANYTEEAAYESYTDDVYDYAEAPMEAEEESSASMEKVEAKDTSRKIIKTVNINAETEEFDTFISNITSKVEALGGYLESTDIRGRSINSASDYLRNASITARIPSARLDDFVTNINDNSNITNKSESAEDVTLGYADTKAHVSSLRTEQERLNELIKEANDIDTLLILEKRLTEVRYEIESYESQLRTMDNKVDYSTVYLNVSEVRKYTPVVTEKQTFGQRVSSGFAESMADVAEGVVNFIAELIIALPYIVVFILFLAIFVLIIFLVVRALIRIVKKIDEKQAKKNEEIIRKRSIAYQQQQNAQNVQNANDTKSQNEQQNINQ